MPEGPEILFMIDTLQDYCNKNLKKLEILSGRYTRHKKPINYNKFANNLPSKIKEIKCKGKFIYFILENNWSIWITLGMTGHFVFDRSKHTHYVFKVNNLEFYLEDMRNFGTFHFYKLNDKKNNLVTKLNSLGLNTLQETITVKVFRQHFESFVGRTPDKMIGILLLDQSFVCGLGNYLRSEILYEAKLSPKLLLKDFTKQQIKDLHKFCCKIPKDSYNHQKKYLMLHSYPFKIYKKEYTPKGEKVKKYKIGNRTVYSIY